MSTLRLQRRFRGNAQTSTLRVKGRFRGNARMSARRMRGDCLVPAHGRDYLFKLVKTRVAAAMVASMSAVVWAADKNPASKADGAK
jgi:hypothetical protein